MKEYTNNDFECEISKILELFTENYDEIFDPDGDKYFLALDYVKERGIDTKDIEALGKLGEKLDEDQMSILCQMKEAESEFEKQKLKDTFSKLSDIQIGLISMMINQHDGDFLA